MNTKILFTDMDGTLLDDHKNISPYSKTCLDRMMALGHKLVLSSGRPLESILQAKKQLHLDYPGVYVISYNGGLIYDCDAKIALWEKRVSFEDTNRILKEATDLGIHCHTYSPTHIISNKQSVELDFYQKNICLPAIITQDILSALSVEPFKLLAINLYDKKKLERLKDVVTAWSSNKLTCTFSNDHYLEFYPLDSGKGNAVKYLCNYLGIPMEHAVAVGDAENDISMLQVVGCGVAMANAAKIVKDSASYTTLSDNNHDGIAEVLIDFFDRFI